MNNLFLKIFVFLTLFALEYPVWSENNTTPDLTSQFDNQDPAKVGITLFNQKKFKIALDYFEKSISQNPKNSLAYYYSAMCCQNLKLYSKAVNYYNQVIQLSDNQNAKDYSKIAINKILIKNLAKNNIANNNISNSNSAKPQAQKSYDKLPDFAMIYYTKSPGSNLLMVDGLVNGSSVSFIFDTGAYGVFFDQQSFSQIGCAASRDAKETKFAGVGSTSGMQAIQTKVDITIGDIHRSQFPVTVSNDYRAMQAVGHPLLGRDFWNGYLIDIDSSTSTIKFFKEGSSRVPEGMDVPFRMYGSHIIVQASINGNLIPMIFDTGASSIVFTHQQALAAGVFLPANARVVQSAGVSGVTQGLIGSIPYLGVGPIQLTDVQVMVVGSSAQTFPLLGQTAFGENWEYIIDYKKHVIHFIQK